MAPRNLEPIVIADLRGGRNGTDPPMSLPMNQAVECLNVDWQDATVARKRGGATSLSLTGGTAFTTILSLFRHVPGASEAAAELWGLDGNALFKRLTGGTSWADVAKDDAATSTPGLVNATFASLNGKLYIAYDTAQDRLHVYDPNLSSPRIRRVNIAPGSNAPTVADTGSGSYGAVARYYRVRWLQISSSVTIRKSEPTPASTQFTPSGSGSAARVTRPTAPSEGETHWLIERSSDQVIWYATETPQAIASTTTDDTGTEADWQEFDATETSGAFGLFPSVKYLLTDGNRLLGAAAWETSGTTSGGKNSRVWFTPVLGSSDKGDDERVPNQSDQKNWIDLNENDGGGITGLGGPINGIVIAFKYRQIWKLTPTGDVTAPYQAKKIWDGIGCIHHKSIAMGEDQIGRPALYFMSHKGPYRIGVNGLEYLGRDNEDIWRTINLNSTAVTAMPTHSLYYPPKHQWWVWIATGSSDTPDTKMMFDVQLGFPDQNGQIRGGWAKHTGGSAGARSSALFSNTVGSSMSSDLKPHVSLSTAVVLKCDTSDTSDNSSAFQAYVKTRPLLTTRDLMQKVGVAESTLLAKAQAATTVTVTIERDFGKETRAHSVSLAAAGSETRVVKKVEGSELGEADVVQMQIGDASATASAWTVDALVTPVMPQEWR